MPLKNPYKIRASKGWLAGIGTHAAILWLRYIRQDAKGHVHPWPFDG
jgi:hypothetical protein